MVIMFFVVFFFQNRNSTNQRETNGAPPCVPAVQCNNRYMSVLPFERSTPALHPHASMSCFRFTGWQREHRVNRELSFSIITHPSSHTLTWIELTGEKPKMIWQQPPEKHVSQQHNRLAGQHRQPAEEWARGKGNSSGTGSAASDLSVTWDVRVRRWLHGGVRKMEGKLIGLCPFISDTLHNSRWQASEERRGWLQRQRRTFLKNQKCLFFPQNVASHT